MPDASLEKTFSGQKWFHSIDFGEFASSGRFKPGSPQNITLYGFMDLVRHIPLAGQTVLDIGAVDGIASFGMKALGAKVHATDSVDRQTFRMARNALGLDIDYHPETQIKDLADKFPRGSFDLVLCAGVFYHMLNPVSALLECRKLIKDGGLLIVETPYYAADERAAIFINSETEMVLEVNTYSVPTKAALLGLMKLACFDVLAVRILPSPNRITVLGRALRPDGVRQRSDLLKRIHEVDFCDYEFRIKDVTPPPGTSLIEYRGPEGEKVVDKSYVPDFPYHPARSKKTVGSTMWTSPTGNH